VSAERSPCGTNFQRLVHVQLRWLVNEVLAVATAFLPVVAASQSAGDAAHRGVTGARPPTSAADRICPSEVRIAEEADHWVLPHRQGLAHEAIGANFLPSTDRDRDVPESPTRAVVDQRTHGRAGVGVDPAIRALPLEVSSGGEEPEG
jgi:hypothetical protein